jgi:hypothetical protein
MSTKWLRTAPAAAHLGRSSRSLLRLIKDGVVTPGTHYLRGSEPNSPITWDIQSLEKRLGELTVMPARIRTTASKSTTAES